MSLSSLDTYDKGEFNEEEIILTLVPATEALTIDIACNKISVSSAMDLKSPVPPMPASQDTNPSVYQALKPHHLLPAILPPIHEVSKNTLGK